MFAIGMDPRYQIAYENRALAWCRLKDYGRAIADNTAAMQINPTPRQFGKRAEAQGAAGDPASADEDLRKTTEVRRAATPL
jgi:hypothetical protein